MEALECVEEKGLAKRISKNFCQGEGKNEDNKGLWTSQIAVIAYGFLLSAWFNVDVAPKSFPKRGSGSNFFRCCTDIFTGGASPLRVSGFSGMGMVE